MSFWVMVKI